VNWRNISNHPQLPSLLDSGPQILIESLVLNTGDKSPNKNGDYPQRINSLQERYKSAFF